METETKTNIYFYNLDGFRTIAFLLVFLGHSFILFDFGESTFITKCLSIIFGKPGIGVHFFFVLSGFLISYLLLSEHSKYQKINLLAFYMRRILRIWPVYFVVILISILLSLIDKPFYSLHNANFWMLATFLTNFNLARYGISSLPITVLWSVAVEEQFYVVLPLLISFLSKKVFLIFPLFIASALIYGALNTRNIALVEFSTWSVCGSLFLGCISAYLVLFHSLSSHFERFSKRVIVLVYVCFLFFHAFRDELFSVAKSNIWYYFIFSIFFAFIILEQNYSKNSFYKMSKFKLLTATGKYTYGLYAYHMIFISILMVFIPKYINPKGNYFIYFALWLFALLGSFILAKFSYTFMEMPFLKLKTRFSSER